MLKNCLCKMYALVSIIFYILCGGMRHGNAECPSQCPTLQVCDFFSKTCSCSRTCLAVFDPFCALGADGFKRTFSNACYYAIQNCQEGGTLVPVPCNYSTTTKPTTVPNNTSSGFSTTVDIQGSMTTTQDSWTTKSLHTTLNDNQGTEDISSSTLSSSTTKKPLDKIGVNDDTEGQDILVPVLAALAGGAVIGIFVTGVVCVIRRKNKLKELSRRNEGSDLYETPYVSDGYIIPVVTEEQSTTYLTPDSIASTPGNATLAEQERGRIGAEASVKYETLNDNIGEENKYYTLDEVKTNEQPYYITLRD